MTPEEQQKFIHSIYLVMIEHPELQERIIIATTQGVKVAIDNLKEQTADMETVAVAYATISEAKGRGAKSTKMWAHNLILSKLKKYQDVTAFMNWSVNIQASEDYLRSEGLIS